MGTNCLSTDKHKQQVPPPHQLFKADLKELHQRYVQLVLYMRSSNIFESRTQQLEQMVEEYITNNYAFDASNKFIACIDSVKLLHPIDCKNSKKVTKQWLIDACLRQHKFCKETRVEAITFDHAYPQYLQFLQLIKGAVGTGKITVPTKCQDVIWHSHMQDQHNYQSDMRKHVGIFLNHMDDFPDEQLQAYTKQTWQRKGLQYSNPKNTIPAN